MQLSLKLSLGQEGGSSARPNRQFTSASNPVIKPKNIIVFGETGSGKSSLVNMLCDTEHSTLAPVNDSIVGVTFMATCYKRRIDDDTYNLYDTVGLNEAHGGTVDATDAIKQLCRLMRSLSDGIHLLVFVVRGPRISLAAQSNYELFFNIFCDKHVPIILFLTHMEDVVASGQDAWLTKNGPYLEKLGMEFRACDCITASVGWNNVRKEQYDRSLMIVKQRIKERCGEPWVPSGGAIPWLKKVVVEMYNMFGSALNMKEMVLNETIYEGLKKLTDLEDDARTRVLANEIAKDIHKEWDKQKKERENMGMKQGDTRPKILNRT